MNTETSIYEYAKQGLMYGRDRVAIRFYGNSLSYGELFDTIDNVADHLHSLGVRRGTVVTIHLPNCPQAVIAIYAVAKLGGICNMVHSQASIFELSDAIEKTGSTVLFTSGSDAGLMMDITVVLSGNENCDPQKVIFFSDIAKPSDHRALAVDQENLSDRCAVYFHSSGTTGSPKTVMHSHAALNRSVSNVRRAYGLNDIQNDSILEVLPLYHGSGFAMDMHLGLSGGACLCPMSKWDAAQAVQMIESGVITSITAVPKVFYSLLSKAGFHGRKLNQCFVGGDVVNQQLKQSFQKRTGIPLFEGYGMTETVSTCCGDRADSEGMRVFPNCDFAVLEDGPKAAGTGELLISTNTLMQGYLDDSDTSVIEWNEKKWLRTGDYGTVTSSGVVNVRGRIKNMIIHNGYNVFPSEVERVIADIEAVEDVAVIGEKDIKTGTQIICAYIVVREGLAAGISSAIKTACDRQLSPYACPQILRFVDKIPRNELYKARMEALR